MAAFSVGISAPRSELALLDDEILHENVVFSAPSRASSMSLGDVARISLMSSGIAVDRADDRRSR